MNTLIIIPVYNERETIYEVLEEIAVYNLPILLIDNASTDTTYTIADAFRKTHTNITLIRNKINIGKAGSIKKAFKYAIQNNYDAVITMDGDMEHDPKYVEKIIKILEEGADIVVAQRIKYRNKLRALLNKFSVYWFQMLISNITDVQCGYRGIKTNLLKKMTLISDGFAIEMEILLEAYKNKARITSFNIETKTRERSNLTRKDYFKMNNFFDVWVLYHYREIRLNMIKKLFLLLAARIGLFFGTIMEKG